MFGKNETLDREYYWGDKDIGHPYRINQSENNHAESKRKIREQESTTS
jgi:hypothetical protein